MATFDLVATNGGLRRTYKNVGDISIQANGGDQNLVKMFDLSGHVLSVLHLAVGDRLDRTS